MENDIDHRERKLGVDSSRQDNFRLDTCRRYRSVLQ